MTESPHHMTALQPKLRECVWNSVRRIRKNADELFSDELCDKESRKIMNSLPPVLRPGYFAGIEFMTADGEFNYSIDRYVVLAYNNYGEPNPYTLIENDAADSSSAIVHGSLVSVVGEHGGNCRTWRYEYPFYDKDDKPLETALDLIIGPLDNIVCVW